MARKSGRSSRRLRSGAKAVRTLAQKKIFLAGIRHGKVLAATALTKKRKAAALKAAETRRSRPKKKKAPPTEGPAIGEVVPELVLYQAPEIEGVPILSGLDFAEWVEPSTWQATVQLYVDGQVMAEHVVPIAAEWDNEAAAKGIRREVRAWYKEQVGEHPEWGESPVATLIRLSLKKG